MLLIYQLIPLCQSLHLVHLSKDHNQSPKNIIFCMIFKVDLPGHLRLLKVNRHKISNFWSEIEIFIENRKLTDKNIYQNHFIKMSSNLFQKQCQVLQLVY